ncbi:methyltransferase [Novosphingobium sp. APW14]|uniref:class I SAM-dependent methyltransferase n=1 Tax=Novosphingobium sp. APW14 TaxID=3077237 RepID=UPI0028DE1D42|nr:methyltransferase [Novosphingobium sp. APW14]MDT9012594.1 methyltransferase [Novosphingobium sp. APW14]
MRRAALLLSALTLALPAAASVAQSTTPLAKAAKADIAAAVASPLRDKDRARDKYRRPAETLEFFQVAPDMKVGEYAPGGEWYSRLLGLYLGPKGKLVGLYFDPTSGAFNEKSQQGIRDGATKYPADVAAASGLPADRFSAMTLEKIPDSEKGTFDRILVMRMMHNLLRWNIADREIKAMRDLLKPDGMIGIEQHRAKPDAPFSYSDGSKGYLREADVIKFMEVNGFTFVGKSEANANKRDPANWEGGVWTLPPVLRGATEESKARLQAIGESDRMTLLFRKRV